jgi:rRNA maturation RNase YbeY
MSKVLNDLGCSDGELSILLTDDEQIARLNSKYLGKEGPTNVLAFPMTEAPSNGLIECAGMLGDIVISVDTTLREAESCGELPAETLFRLLIHGLLHLLGYDHERSNEEAALMQEIQDRLLALIDCTS